MRLRRDLDGTRIIGITAIATTTLSRDRFLAVCDDCLIKPFRIEQLLDKIGAQLGIVWDTAPLQTSAHSQERAEDPRISPVSVPLEDLKELHALAMMGDMREIRIWADRFERRDEKYAEFSRELRELAGSFRTRAILEIVENRMEAGK
jgi:hypothetical protein